MTDKCPFERWRLKSERNVTKSRVKNETNKRKIKRKGIDIGECETKEL